MIVEEAQGVDDAITEDDGLRGIVGVRHVDFKLGVAAFAMLFVAEGLAADVGDAEGLDEERVVESLGIGVLDGNGAVNAVPGTAGETGFDGFGDVDGAVGVHQNFVVKVLDGELARGSGRQRSEQCGEQCEKAQGENVARRTHPGARPQQH